MEQYSRIFLDMDGTVTRSRSEATPDMKTALRRTMESGRHIMIVSGQGVENMEWQVGMGDFYMGQNGNHVVDTRSGSVLWNESLTDVEKTEIMRHIGTLPREAVRDTNDLIEDRGSQISYSTLGHHEDIAKKEAYDPDGTKRRRLLSIYPFTSSTLEVKIAGTTTLDYLRKGFNKGTNIMRLIVLKGWKPEECVYIGDKLFPGGNDEAVMGVIDTIPVKNPDDTLELIEKIVG